MSKDSIYILLRNNYQDIQAKHEKKACSENNQVEEKKKPPPSIFSRRKGTNNNKQKSIHIYYFKAKNKGKPIIMVTCEERRR